MVPITEERRSLIMQELERNHIVKVAELSDQLGVSQVSIRRDLDHLEERGLLRRVHGGAVSVSSIPLGNNLRTKIQSQGQKKERIGRVAAEMIAHGERVILDSGTTPLQVANNLSHRLVNNFGKLTVITNSLPVVYALGLYPSVHLILLGGIYLHEYQVVVGPQTIDHLKGLHADKMFLGTDGLTFSQGITTANVLEAEVDRAMVKASNEVIVVSDSSKIDVMGLATIMPLSEIDKLITDSDAPSDFVARLRDEGVEVILV